MRLWTIHPSFLDQKGLCGLWRETLVGLKALEKGPGAPWYNHPQLARFKVYPNGLAMLAEYAEHVLDEGHKRGYNFNTALLEPYLELYEMNFDGCIMVTKGQFDYEVEHFIRKLASRDEMRYQLYMEKMGPRSLYQPKIEVFVPNPVFRIVDGPIEVWEKVS